MIRIVGEFCMKYFLCVTPADTKGFSLSADIHSDSLLYKILCSNEDKEEEFNFAFFADLENGGVVPFKNKQHVAWKKKEPKISYKDHSDTQVQH